MIKEKLKKFVSSWWFFCFIGVVVFCFGLIVVPLLSKAIFPVLDKNMITASENCGISADETSLLEKLGVEVKLDTWVDCFQAQKALKEYYKNELENSHRKVREALGPVGGHF